MEGRENTNAAASSTCSACPHCNRPITTAGPACNLAPETPASKRKPGASATSSSSAKKRVRRSETGSSGKFERPWHIEKNKPVWVNVDDGRGSKQWEKGVVHHVEDSGDGAYKIVVHVQDDSGDWVIPRTFNAHNQDPIPTMLPSDPDYRLSEFIMQRDESLDGLTRLGTKLVQCVRSHSSGKAAASEEQNHVLDTLGESLVGVDPNAPDSFRNLVGSLMVDKRVNEVVRVATKGNDVCSPQLALAYLVGQLCGIEMSESDTGDSDPKLVLNRFGRDEQIDCPISQVFLVSAMTARTHKMRDFHPDETLYDSRARAMLSDPEKLEARLARSRTALAAIHASQMDKPPVGGPSFALLQHGISMLIDMRGTSDPLLNKLAEEGVCRPARVLRDWIQKLAAAIDPLNVRAPAPEGETQFVAWVADNADHHLHQRCVSCVPVGNLLLGTERKEDTAHFHAKYMRGLGKLSDLGAEDLLPTKEQDQVARRVRDNHNIALDATCYREGKVKSQSVVTIDYNLCRLADKYRPARDERDLPKKLHTAYYGALFDERQRVAEICAPFDPIAEVKFALQNEGFYPSIKVSGDLLPEPPALPSEADGDEPMSTAGDADEEQGQSVDSDDAQDDLIDTEDEGSDEERSVAGSMSGIEDEGDDDSESEDDS